MTPDQIEKAHKLLAVGMSLSFIGRVMGVTHMTVKYWTESPQYRQRHAERNNELRRIRSARRMERCQSAKPEPEPERVTIDEWRRLLREIPKDTRDLTARICGDPLPGRSELDRRARA